MLTRPQPGDRAFDPKIGKERTFVRRAAVGLFSEAAIWAVEGHVAHAGSPVPWDTFAMPSGPPGSPEWAAAELAAVKRVGVHEAMESFGHDPHMFPIMEVW